LDSFCIGEIKVDKDNHVIEKDSETHYDIQLKKGILWQEFIKLNKKQYLEFIHDPKHMINPPETILFETPFLEIFTKTPYWVILILWVPIHLLR
jgi:4-hydroxysphinganine ceramide fatty acyl 2-hydroxylase